MGSYEISTGQKLGTTTITNEMENKLKEGLAQGLSEEEVFKNNKTKTNDLYLKRVQIKTDIQGVEVDISAIKNAKMQRKYIEKVIAVLKRTWYDIDKQCV